MYEITKGTDTQYDREMESDNWTHPSMYINTIEGNEESVHPIQAYTDGSKSDSGVGAGVVIFLDNTKLVPTMQYRLNERCTNIQVEQMAILKALEYIQHMEPKEKAVMVYTDSQIALQLLKVKQSRYRPGVAQRGPGS